MLQLNMISILGQGIGAINRCSTTLLGGTAATSGRRDVVSQLRSWSFSGMAGAQGNYLGKAAEVSSSEADTMPSTDFGSMSYFQESRFGMAYQEIFYREMMLKTTPRDWTSVPRLRSITLTISAALDTRLDKAQAPKSDLLLHKLALEQVAGQPASFIEPGNQSGTGRAEGVTTELKGETMLNFLEKLVYMILPNQIGFEGASAFQEVQDAKPPRPYAKPLESAEEIIKHFYSEVKVTNLMLYPDFEQNFDIFEPLRSMQVRFVVEGASSPDMATSLMTAFSMPMKKEVSEAP